MPTVDVEGFPVPMPSLINAILVSMDDRYLYFSNRLYGDLRQYNISDPANPTSEGYVLLCVARPNEDCVFDVGVERHDRLYVNLFASAAAINQLERARVK